jgi:hypothetical protein
MAQVQQPIDVMEVEFSQWLAGLAEPMVEAQIARQRWHYILTVAEAAIAGQVLDRSLGQVVATPDRYAELARRSVERLTAWIERNEAALEAPIHRICYADLSVPAHAIR